MIFSFAMKRVFFFLFLTSWKVSLISCDGFDQSTLAACSRVVFPEPGQRVCYRRSVTPDECNVVDCTLSIRPPTQGNITIVANSMKIASPRFFRTGGQYQNRRLCQYNVPNCPAGTISHYEWNSQNFVLEDPVNIEGSDLPVCLDHVSITLDLEGFGLALGQNQHLCGSPQDFSMRLSGLPLLVEFRSDTAERFSGFRIDVVCTPVQSENMDSTSVPGRRRRRNAGLSEDMYNGRGERDMLVRARRTANVYTITPRMTEMNCTEVIGFSQPPIPVTPLPLPQTGNRSQIPRLASLVYKNRILKVVQSGLTLRSFSSITRLFFHTGFNGTRAFTTSAFVPFDEIYGGGTLLIVKDCAYYNNFMSPPRLEPNCRELDIISVLANATSPFFVDQDIDDEDDDDIDPPTMTPYTHPPTYTHPPSAPITTTPPPTTGPGIDPRVDPDALRLALEFENACNIYLRQAARSFIEILEINNII